MPALVAWILAGLGWALTSWIGGLLTTFGLAFIVQEYVVDDWRAQLAGLLGGLPAFLLNMLGYFGVDVALTIILSAYAVKFASGTISGIRRRGAAAVAVSE